MDCVGAIMEYESGEMDAKRILDLFSELIHSGMAWKLQGNYGRTAQSLIENGYLDKDGNIIHEDYMD